MLALTVYALVLGAWESRNRYAMLGGLRAAAQMLSYEAFFGLLLMGVVMLSGSLSLGPIVLAQEGLWFVVLQPLGFALFFLAGIAAAHRLPFDLQESENDLVAGFMTEYSGMSFALFPERMSGNLAGGGRCHDAVFRRLAGAGPARSGSA